MEAECRERRDRAASDHQKEEPLRLAPDMAKPDTTARGAWSISNLRSNKNTANTRHSDVSRYNWVQTDHPERGNLVQEVKLTTAAEEINNTSS